MQRLELFSNSRFHVRIWQFGNHNVSRKLPQSLASVFLLLFYTKSWHADLEFVRKFCFLSLFIYLLIYYYLFIYFVFIMYPLSFV